MCVLYFPIWIGLFAQESGDEYPKLAKFLNNKLVVYALLIIWFIAVIVGMNFLKMNN